MTGPDKNGWNTFPNLKRYFGCATCGKAKQPLYTKDAPLSDPLARGALTFYCKEHATSLGASGEIAGPSWKGAITRECQGMATVKQVVTWIKAEAERISAESVESATKVGCGAIALFLENSLLGRELERVRVDCPFEGDVDAQGDRGEIWWDCPICAVTHGEDMPEREAD